MVGKAWKNYRRRQETLDLRHFCLSMVLIQTCRGSDDEANKTFLKTLIQIFHFKCQIRNL